LPASLAHRKLALPGDDMLVRAHLSIAAPFRLSGLAFVVGLVSLLGLTACNKKNSGSNGGVANCDSELAGLGFKDTVTVDSGMADPIANTTAVNGGTYTTWSAGWPKSLNMWLDYSSFSVEVMGLLFEPLMQLHSTQNHPVGVLADSFSISEDKKTFTFRLDPRARWSDGQPITAEDVVFYYSVIMNPKNLTPIFRVGLSRFDAPIAVDAHTVRITAHEAHWNNFWEAAGLMAFPKHLWDGKDFNQINFDFSVVSGPYAIAEIKTERSLLLKRRTDWWGRGKRYNQNKYNFGTIRYRFMEDRDKALEAFKKGDFDVYPVYTAAIWAEKTHFDQVTKGWVARHNIYNREPLGFQGFAINLRRPIFQDARVREALCHLLNRELMNDKLMYNQYFLLNSYYPDLYPGNKNPEVPLCVYDPEKARQLLTEAGWKPGSDGVLAKAGQRFSVTIPLASQDLRHYNIYLEDLKKAGIDARLDQISASTLTKRIDAHEFDLYWEAWGAGRLRDPEAQWLSKTAEEVASNNHAGVKDKAIDSLIALQKTEMDLDKRNAILTAIDARLSAIKPYVLLWQADHHRMLWWTRFGMPKYALDKFNREDAVLTYWFVDPAKAKTLCEAKAAGSTLPADTAAVYYEE
jgi:microcin C transport system substrate-binding protein